MILCGDALAVLKTMRAATFDGAFCDPPYGLTFMGRQWDKGVPGWETWAEVLRVLKSGAMLLAFGGTRTHHRLACAIEDAGFELVDVLIWLHGQGFPKAKSQLKPAWEPIIMARKRGAIRPLAIDASRIKTRGVNLGRWPANVILDEDAAAALDAQSGHLVSGNNPAKRSADKHRTIYAGWKGEQCLVHRGTDSGGASRFFYCAKASRSERGDNTHPTVKPLKLTEYLARLILPPDGGKLIVPFAGSGSEMLGARRAGWKVTGIESDAAYVKIAERRLAATA